MPLQEFKWSIILFETRWVTSASGPFLPVGTCISVFFFFAMDDSVPWREDASVFVENAHMAVGQNMRDEEKDNSGGNIWDIP